MKLNNLKGREIILASKSPRRQQILSELGLDFIIKNNTNEVDENYPQELQREQIPLYLAQHKAANFEYNLNHNTILITSDTIVWLEGEVLGKPENSEQAKIMLRKLSGKQHEVITGVSLKSKTKHICFSVETKVFFKELSDAEIDFYVEKFKPFDKAGAYGIQEWIGYIGIERIEGSYFNVVGLPVQRLYEELRKF